MAKGVVIERGSSERLTSASSARAPASHQELVMAAVAGPSSA
jgi:hypothetical protein